MQIRWAVGVVLVAALAGCGESAEAKYARALQVYNAELELRDRAERHYEDTRKRTFDFLSRKMDADRKAAKASTPPGDDLLEAFNERKPDAFIHEAEADAAELTKATTANPQVKLAADELAAAERRLEYAAKLLKECEATR
jgi:hypothetical protein